MTIPSVIRSRAPFAWLCSLFLVVAFLFAQMLSVAHSHDHLDAGPHKQNCEVCILAVKDDGDLHIVADIDGDTENVSFLWARIDRLAIAAASIE